MKTTVLAVVMTLISVTAQAQTRFAWQQEFSSDPSGLLYRVYFLTDDRQSLAASVVTQTVCSGVPPTFDCTGIALPPPVWGWAYMTAQLGDYETVWSNVIPYVAPPINQIPVPAPKNFRMVP